MSSRDPIRDNHLAPLSPEPRPGRSAPGRRRPGPDPRERNDAEQYHVTLKVRTIERPALLFDGETPIALFGAASDNKNRDGTFNVRIPLKSKPQA